MPCAKLVHRSKEHLAGLFYEFPHQVPLALFSFGLTVPWGPASWQGTAHLNVG